jgi:hypothetical protein
MDSSSRLSCPYMVARPKWAAQGKGSAAGGKGSAAAGGKGSAAAGSATGGEDAAKSQRRPDADFGPASDGPIATVHEVLPHGGTIVAEDIAAIWEAHKVDVSARGRPGRSRVLALCGRSDRLKAAWRDVLERLAMHGETGGRRFQQEQEDQSAGYMDRVRAAGGRNRSRLRPSPPPTPVSAPSAGLQDAGMDDVASWAIEHLRALGAPRAPQAASTSSAASAGHAPLVHFSSALCRPSPTISTVALHHVMTVSILHKLIFPPASRNQHSRRLTSHSLHC